MAGESDVTFEMEFGDGQWVAVGPEVLDLIPHVVEEELARLLGRVADRLAWKLRDEYQTLIRSRPRNEGQSLRDRVLAAVTTGIERRLGGVEIGVFNLGQIRRQTKGEGAGDRSLFEIMEEGYDTTMPYGFVGLEAARKMAEALATQFDLGADERADLMAYVDREFRGRHGEGIMVNVFAPFFFRYPQFGTPFEHGFLPHGQWDGWNVLSEIDGPLAAEAAVEAGGAGGGSKNWILALLEQAFANAAKRLKTLAT